jgi:hypothetical protein
MYVYMPFGSLECHLFGEFFSISSMFESWFKPSYYHQFLGMLDMQFYKPFTRVEGGGLRAKAGISLLFIIHLGTCVGH